MRTDLNIRELLERGAENIASIIDDNINAARVSTPCFLNLGRDDIFRGRHIQIEDARPSVLQMHELRFGISSGGDDIVSKSPELMDKLSAEAAGAASDEPGLRCHGVSAHAVYKEVQEAKAK